MKFSKRGQVQSPVKFVWTFLTHYLQHYEKKFNFKLFFSESAEFPKVHSRTTFKREPKLNCIKVKCIWKKIKQ